MADIPIDQPQNSREVPYWSKVYRWVALYRTPSSNGSLEKYPLIREAALMRRLTRRVRDLVQQIKPDILHAYCPVLNAIPALRVGKEFGIPVIYESFTAGNTTKERAWQRSAS